MDEQAMLVGAILLFGLLLFVILQLSLGLHRSNGVRHQNRNIYSLAASMFFAVVLVMMLRPDAAVWAKSAMAGLVLSFLPIYWSRAVYRNKVVDGHILVGKGLPAKGAVVAGITVLATMTLLGTAFGATLLEARWPFLGVAIAWLLLATDACWRVFRLEHQQGRPLMEKSD